MRRFPHQSYPAVIETLNTRVHTPFRKGQWTSRSRMNLFQMKEGKIIGLVFFQEDVLTLVRGLSSFPDLIRLTMHECSNRIFPEIFLQSTQLQYLSIQKTPIEQLPDEICSFLHLKELLLNKTGLLKLPHEIGNLVELERMYVKHGKLETLPENFGNLRSLRNLQLNYNLLQGFPASFRNLSNLERLDLYNNPIQTLSGVPRHLLTTTGVNIDRNVLKIMSQPLFNALNCYIFPTNHRYEAILKATEEVYDRFCKYTTRELGLRYLTETLTEEEVKRVEHEMSYMLRSYLQQYLPQTDPLFTQYHGAKLTREEADAMYDLEFLMNVRIPPRRGAFAYFGYQAKNHHVFKIALTSYDHTGYGRNRRGGFYIHSNDLYALPRSFKNFLFLEKLILPQSIITDLQKSNVDTSDVGAVLRYCGLLPHSKVPELISNLEKNIDIRPLIHRYPEIVSTLHYIYEETLSLENLATRRFREYLEETLRINMEKEGFSILL